MTVSSSLSTQTFSCDGSTTVFTCPFRVLEASELVGYLITIATNESALLVNGTDFAVTGVGATNAIATTTLAYSADYRVNFRRRTQRLQSTDYRDNDPFPAESHENALDRLTHIAQENDADIARALLAPEPETGITLPSAAERAGLLLGFDSEGLPIAVAPTSGSASDLALDLASTATSTKGAGQVGYNSALGYLGGTVGGRLNEFSGAGGAALVGWTSSLPGGVLRTAADRFSDTISVFDFMTTAQRADVRAGTLLLDVTTAVQAAIDAAYGRRLLFPRGGYKLTAALEIDPILGGATNLPMHIIGDGFDANGGNGGTFFRVAHAGNGITIDNSYGINADARFIIEGLAIIGEGTDVLGGDGIYAKNVSNLICRDLWVQGMRRDGIRYERCYGSAVSDCVLLNNREWGFFADRAFNLGDMQRIKAYGNGRTYSSAISGNVCIRGSGDESLGVVLQNIDVSYAGTAAFRLYKRGDSTLVSIVVSGGVATATTATAHSRTTGELVAVVGATVDLALNTGYPPAITVTGATTFTFATSAANGTYTEASIQIGPAAFGLFVDQVRGLKLAAYSEDCFGPALYLGAEVRSFEVVGGYWQGGTHGAVIINDSATNGRYAAMHLAGAQARMLVNVPAGEHGVDVATSVTANAGASITLPSLYMRNGSYYATASPTTGAWAAGRYIKRSNPTVGQPKGWYCTVGGTPGTWVSEGNL